MNLSKLVKEALGELLFEELPLSMARDIMKMKRSPEAEELLNKIFTKLAALPNAKTSKRGDRVYIPFKGSGSVTKKTNSHEDEISKFLEDNDYELLDYKKGLAKDQYGRQMKLGKALTKLKNQELLNKFNNDKSRESIRSEGNMYLVFSRHPYDLAGMSVNRGWTSCMELERGIHGGTYISKDIEHGSFIVYLVKSDDLNINNPIARVLVKPFFNVMDPTQVFYFTEKKIYGTPPSSFKRTVKKIIETLQNIPTGAYKLNDDLYCDSAALRITDDLRKRTNFNRLPKTKDELLERLKIFQLDLSKITVHSDLTITYNGDLKIDIKHLLAHVKMMPFKFRFVNGNFTVMTTLFKTLVNFPLIVRGNFLLTDNFKFPSLEHGPKEVHGDFICDSNKLYSLQGSPVKVHGSFNCSSNKLQSLEGGPKEVGKDYNCAGNFLTDLSGTPKKIVGNFDCSFNDVQSLEGGPKEVGGDYICSSNGLNTLKGAPSKIFGNFDCSHNSLTTLDGASQYVGEDFICFNNTITFTEEDVRAVTKVDGKVIVDRPKRKH